MPSTFQFAARAGGLLLGLMVSSPTPAQPLTREQSDFFENRIRPIFVNDCYKCHSQQAPKLKGGLSLETRDGWLKGGDNGPVVVPGDPEKSPLIKAVRYTDENLQMPPKGQKLSDAKIADLEAWVKMGAPDPRTGVVVAANKSTRDHWSFKSIQNPPVPEVKETNWIRTPIDNFIVAKLEANGMQPNPIADKRTLIRRATFDLIGLPPTTQEVNDFLNDDSPDAFAKVVDRLLASPHYGERWGRYWLDVARYSDTKGDVQKIREDYHYPYAWTYRDYVIGAFNADRPFNRFILEQMAADKLVQTQPDKSIVAAMGFLTVGERFEEKQNDIINDRIDVVTKGFLGLTVTCARCHDHKFDPIPTKDYYSLHGVFASCNEPAQEPIIYKIKQNSTNYIDYSQKTATLNNQMAALEEQRKQNRGNRAKVRPILQQEAKLREEQAQLELDYPDAPVRAMMLVDSPTPKDSPVFIRGEAENKGPIVPRQFLEILSPPNRVPFQYGSGRVELANDIASPNNPLTARVIVNRIWLHHFDEGIVTTPDDFGNQSAPPSHPELLDYLATRFMADGWSIKKLHRLIMLSSVYQESSENNPRYAQIDPMNRWLWRANIRRMDFEEVRDSLLAIGGKLDETMGGRPVSLGAYPYSTRRTIYGFIDRRNLPELYNQFDFANPDITTGKRYETIVPQQSLFLMNSPLVIEQARNLVARPDFTTLTNDEDRVKLLYELCYQREPNPVEIQLGVDFVLNSPENESVPRMFVPKNANPIRAKKLADSFASVPTDRQPLKPWEKYAHALLQANEAIFVN
jgi:mono/diheme cytochrome c family protein